jgi:hypothetical protein
MQTQKKSSIPIYPNAQHGVLHRLFQQDNDRAGRRQSGHLFGKRALRVICALVLSEG